MRAVAVKEEKKTTQFKSLFWAARLNGHKQKDSWAVTSISFIFNPSVLLSWRSLQRASGGRDASVTTYSSTTFLWKEFKFLSLSLKGRGGCWGYVEIWICSIPVCLLLSLLSGTQQCVMTAQNSHSLAGLFGGWAWWELGPSICAPSFARAKGHCFSECFL